MVSDQLLEQLSIKPEFLANGRVKYNLSNHYVIETYLKDNNLCFEMFWEKWGYKILFTKGIINNEQDFLYYVEYSNSCESNHD